MQNPQAKTQTEPSPRFVSFDVPVGVGLQEMRPDYLIEILANTTKPVVLTRKGEFPAGCYPAEGYVTREGIVNEELLAHPSVARRFAERTGGYFFDEAEVTTGQGYDSRIRRVNLADLVGALSATTQNIRDNDERASWTFKTNQLGQLRDTVKTLDFEPKIITTPNGNANLGRHHEKGIGVTRVFVEGLNSGTNYLHITLGIGYSPNNSQFRGIEKEANMFLTAERAGVIAQVVNEYALAIAGDEKQAADVRFVKIPELSKPGFSITQDNYISQPPRCSLPFSEVVDSVERVRAKLNQAVGIEWRAYKESQRRAVTELTQALARTD